MTTSLAAFTIAGKTWPVSFNETLTIAAGLECDTYTFTSDAARDLAIVRVTKGCSTPRPRVLSDDKTIEGFVSGISTLRVRLASGETRDYRFRPGGANRPVVVEVGQTMQWHADDRTGLTFYEICEPPYVDG
jgi:hypothetical protein